MKRAAPPASNRPHPNTQPHRQVPPTSPRPSHRTRRAPSPLALALAGLLALALLVAGCGGSTTASTSESPAPASSKAANAHNHVPRVEKVEISSPVIPPAGTIPAKYTCDGTGESPPLQWKGIPPGTAELQLDLLRLKPVGGKLQMSWALAGIDPKSTGVAAGRMPAGAIPGLNVNGHTHYELCPAKNTNEEYVFVLFAIPHAQKVKPGFDAVTQRLRAIRAAKYEGFLVFTYPRH